MILADSSVWIYYYRPNAAEKIKKLIVDAIVEDQIAVNGQNIMDLGVRGVRGGRDNSYYPDVIKSIYTIVKKHLESK